MQSLRICRHGLPVPITVALLFGILLFAPPGVTGGEGDAAQNAPAGAAVEYVDGEVLVAFRPGTGSDKATAVRAGLGASKIKEFKRIGVRHWRLPPGLSVEEAAVLIMREVWRELGKTHKLRVVK